MKRLKALIGGKIAYGVAAITVVAVMAVSFPACVPTYPREELPEAVKTICKIEYDMDVEVTVVGSTMGIYYPMEGLLDVNLGISEEAWDEISNLILVASRVVLSTDADIQFYCVITQDAKLPELQVVIIKYVDDIKRSMYRDISRTESFRRTLFSINLTPQAKKERSIEKVFNKMGVGEDTRQKVLDEFFRSPPTKLSDIGYWRDKFYLKDITMPEFLVAQIASRIKLNFKGEKKLEERFDFKSAEGLYSEEGHKKEFLVKFKIGDNVASEGKGTLQREKVGEILKVANRVVYGYKYKDFSVLEMEDQLENVKLSVKSTDVYDFSKKKLSVVDVVTAPYGYFGN